MRWFLRAWREVYLQAQRHKSRGRGSVPQNSLARKIPGGKAVVVEAVTWTLEAVLDSHTRSQHCPCPTGRSALAAAAAAGAKGTEGAVYQCSSASWLLPPANITRNNSAKLRRFPLTCLLNNVLLYFAMADVLSRRPHRGGPGLCPGQSTWDLWWSSWHWDRFFSEFFDFFLSISFHRGSPYSCII
jgi:hypothetical protein